MANTNGSDPGGWVLQANKDLLDAQLYLEELSGDPDLIATIGGAILHAQDDLANLNVPGFIHPDDMG